jgi:hypothetical protein
MRVLSVQQPWAQLIVRGLLTFDVRSYPPKKEFRGRIAIHASNRVPSKEIENEWTRDEDTAKVFASQGWRGRNDLKDLPRQAIVGTVELRDVVLGKELHLEGARQIPRWDMNEAIHAALGRKGGRFGWAEPSLKPARLPIPDEEYAWIFAMPVEIDPIVEIEGQQHLWSLPKEIASELVERNTRARTGQWKPAAPDASKRKRALDDWARNWSQVYEDEAWRLILEAHWELQREWFPFEDEGVEKSFRQTIEKLQRERGVVVPGRGLHMPVEPELQKWFGGRSLVRAIEYEATLREEIREAVKKEAEDKEAHRKHAVLVELLKELKGKAARRPMSQAEIKARVKAEFRRMIEEAVERDEEGILRAARAPQST